MFHKDFDSIFIEKTRLSIMTITYKEEKVSFNRLKLLLELNDGTLYSHLKKLEAADYLKMNKTIIDNSAATLCSLTEKGKETLEKYIEYLEAYLNKIKT
ncbi:MAG: transcriptional regulator [Spirochaetales bacterium]|nr:transcriptional regulator [Spirochaetales bacterium]